MKMTKTLAILALAAAIGSGYAYAQGGPPPGDDQQGGPPPAGPGGPGGQMRFGGGQRMMGGPMLLMNPAVQKELKLTDDQIAKVRDLMPRRPRGGEQGGPEGQNAPRQRPNPQEMDKKIQDILDAGQYRRLSEIRLQMQGPFALMRPEIAEKLGLSDDQKGALRDLFQQERQNPPPNPGSEPSDFHKTMQERRAKLEKGALAILTDSQRDKWHEMTGTPFKMPMGPGFGGRGRFGGPGGPGGGPGGDGPPPPPGSGDGGPGGGTPPPPPPGDGGGQ